MKVGDRVKVSFEGTVEEIRDRNLHLGIRHVVRSDNGAAHMLFSLAEGEDFTVQRKDPELWPPQRGDVWKDGKSTWFARNDMGPIMFYNATVGVGGEMPSGVLKNHPDLHLVYRDF